MLANLFQLPADMWIAGAETSVTTLRWALLHLLHHPEVQAKVRQEIHSVVGKERSVEMADRTNMPYTNATLNEVQRLSNLLEMNELHSTTKEVIVNG